MHPYSINSEEHNKIAFYLAIISIFLAWLLHLLSSNLFEIPWFIESPSVIGFYGILYAWFNTHLWKIGFLHKLNIIKTPIIEGKWTGTISSSSELAKEEICIESFTIKQTWTHISIYLETSTSESYSTEASMTVDQFGTKKLHYQYLNKPKDGSPSAMHMHYGTVSAKIKDESEIMAEYYSGRDRNNTGSFKVKIADEYKVLN